MNERAQTEFTDFNPEHRELCQDGACIGIIGPDARCRECGLPAKSATTNPRNRGLRTTQEIVEELETNIATSDLAKAPESFEDRQLCSDGSCIGVIGTDGTCPECGKPAPLNSE